MDGNDHTKYAINTQCWNIEIEEHKQITNTKK